MTITQKILNYDQKIKLVEEGKIAEVLCQLSIEEREVIINQTKTAINVFESYKQALSKDP
jgi:sulfur carrier protein ThiS